MPRGSLLWAECSSLSQSHDSVWCLIVLSSEMYSAPLPIRPLNWFRNSEEFKVHPNAIVHSKPHGCAPRACRVRYGYRRITAAPSCGSLARLGGAVKLEVEAFVAAQSSVWLFRIDVELLGQI